MMIFKKMEIWNYIIQTVLWWLYSGIMPKFFLKSGRESHSFDFSSCLEFGGRLFYRVLVPFSMFFSLSLPAKVL